MCIRDRFDADEPLQFIFPKGDYRHLLPSARQHPSYDDCLEVKREYLSELFCAGLCDIMFTVSSTLTMYVSSSYRSNRLGLSHWDPYAVCRGGCLELYYCNMVEWFWSDSSLISTTNWFPSVLWHCRFGHLACKIVPIIMSRLGR